MPDSFMQRLSTEAVSAAALFPTVMADDVSGLSPEKARAWPELLCSMGSAEGTEENLMIPLLDAFAGHPQHQSYLRLHAEDESRHADAFRKYSEVTFQHRKKGKTFTDRVIYDGVFQAIRKVGAKRPAPILAGIYFYEFFTEKFYRQVIEAARRDGLVNLETMLTRVEKDELRHRAGVKYLLGQCGKLVRPLDAIDSLLAKTLVGIVVMDINMHPAAIYNRRVQRNLKTLGFSTDELFREAITCAKITLERVRHARN